MQKQKEKPTSPEKITFKNILRYLQGWKRYIVYYLTKRSIFLKRVSDSIDLLPKHKKEQFEWRLLVMNKKCLQGGNCVICGCQTPQLQMIDDACSGKCYPKMMDEKEWNEYKIKNHIII